MWLRAAAALTLCLSAVSADNHTDSTSSSIIGWHWDHVETPVIGAVWLLVASIAKILFHVNKRFGEAVPDSALLISVGLVLGLILKYSHVNEQVYFLNSTVFFLYLLPPIIFDAGYFMPNRQLFENFGSVMMFAVVGTIWNTVAIGLTLRLVSVYSDVFTVQVGFVEAFIFASLISAVDPVAVITVFEEIHVNEFLFINVFGEALFNDGIAAVLFQIFSKMSLLGPERLAVADYAVFGGSFFAVAVGGAFLGVMFALLGAIATRYTQRVKIIGPVFVFVIPYLAYLAAEMVGLSAILAICCCGIVMKQYVKQNITHDAAASVKYFVKMLAQSSETLVFMFLGLSAISSDMRWDFGFIVISLIACLLYRTIGVVVQCAILNRFRNKKFTFEDQFVMSYGGLRGAIAFGLLSSIPATVAPEVKAVFSSTTIVVICFTVFLQGGTIRPLLNLLKVEKSDEHQMTMVEQIYNKYFDYTMAGVEDIAGQKGSHSVRDWFERLNANFLNPLLTKQSTRNVFDASQIVRAYQKITLQEAMEVVALNKRPARPAPFRPRRVAATVSSDTRQPSQSSASDDDGRRLDLDRFLSSTENMEALYGMFSQLMDRKLREYHLDPRRRPPAADEDDIKDDYLSALTLNEPSMERDVARWPATRSEALPAGGGRLERRLSQPIFKNGFSAV